MQFRYGNTLPINAAANIAQPRKTIHHRKRYQNMVSQTSAGILVSADIKYQPGFSNPFADEYLFSYTITIENQNNFPVQLMRRHWYIFESNGLWHEVEGEGVVGVQPVIQPGQQYEYTSGCNLKTEIGKMQGTYEMIRYGTNRTFTVSIPAMEMIVPFKNN
jgi:ApaG protein